MLKSDDWGLEFDPDGANCSGVVAGTWTCLRGRPGPLFKSSGLWLDTIVNPWSSICFAAVVSAVAVDASLSLLNSTVFSISLYCARWTLVLYTAKLGHVPFCHDKWALPQLQHCTEFFGQSLV